MVVRFVAALALLFLVSVGCRNARERGGAKARCDADVAALRAWMAEVDHEGAWNGTLPPADGPLVVLDERAAAIPDGPVLTVKGALLLYNGAPSGNTLRPADAVEELGKKRRDAEEMWRMVHPGTPAAPRTPLVVALAAGDRWGDLAPALDTAARAGYKRAAFVFDARFHMAPPPPSRVSRYWQRRERTQI